MVRIVIKRALESPRRSRLVRIQNVRTHRSSHYTIRGPFRCHDAQDQKPANRVLIDEQCGSKGIFRLSSETTKARVVSRPRFASTTTTICLRASCRRVDLDCDLGETPSNRSLVILPSLIVSVPSPYRVNSYRERFFAVESARSLG
jgi:hypothetical protein